MWKGLRLLVSLVARDEGQVGGIRRPGPRATVFKMVLEAEDYRVVSR